MKKSLFLIICIAVSMSFVSCDKEESNPFSPEGVPEPLMHNGHEYVDLGIVDDYRHPIYWATYNVGATKSEDYGGYFAWGETEEKTSYDRGNYKYYLQTNVPTKYNLEDQIRVLEATDDAASVNWGGLWRTPTQMDFFLLHKYCTWTKVEKNGVVGYKVVGKNGNSIFLPCSGYVSGSEKRKVGSGFLYWTSQTDYLINGIYGAWYLTLNNDLSINWCDSGMRYCGQSVRPVFNPEE